jgi:hypothetical protein
MAKGKNKGMPVPRSIFPSHPLVGAIADEIAGFGASAHTQVQAGFHGHLLDAPGGLETAVSSGNVRGPVPRRRVVPYGYDSQLRLRTYTNPKGYPTATEMLGTRGKK